jgi:soluble lytic murein transglycosylase
MKYLIRTFLLLPALACAMPGDDKFLAAREAFRVGEPVRLARMAEELKGNDLAPWAEYWQLTLRVSGGQQDGVEDFLVQHGGSYLAEKLRSDWLKALGKRAMWSPFLTQFPLLTEPDQEILCYAEQARLATQKDRAVPEDVRDLWFAANDLPEACMTLMDRLVSDKRLLGDDVWARVRAQLDQSKYAEAKSAARYLPDDNMPEQRTLERIAAKPSRYLDHLPTNPGKQRLLRETILFALQRQARKDTADAVQRWEKIEARFPAEDSGYLWGQFARQAARLHMIEALSWYDKAGSTPLSDDQQAWRVRAALRVSNWSAVLRAIDKLPINMSMRPDWVYWRGRALAATGHGEEALALYRRICGQPGFYGMLAADELGLPLALPPRAAPPSSEELAAANANPGLRQALALFRLDMRTEGVREWNWTVRNLTDRELLAAAELARRNDVFDRTISTAEKTLAEHDYSLRYLAPYRETVSPKAQALALDDSWVYGLMRQESRFITSAKSGVGARGLMQVMPATAKLVARKIGMIGYRPGHVDDMDTNVTLGTNYLKMVLQSLDNHPVLACTAYNAGPGRAQRWRGDKALEGAIYAETIPFAETRDYVKKVMTNSVYYSALFEEKPQSLKSRLGVIQPARAADKAFSDVVDGDGATP